MMGDKPAGRDPRDLHDSVPRDVDLRGDIGLVDPDSSVSNNSFKGGMIGAVFVEDRTHRSSATTDRGDASNVGSRAFASRLSLSRITGTFVGIGSFLVLTDRRSSTDL